LLVVEVALYALEALAALVGIVVAQVSASEGIVDVGVVEEDGEFGSRATYLRRDQNDGVQQCC
jgi:riboflavin synthase